MVHMPKLGYVAPPSRLLEKEKKPMIGQKGGKKEGSKREALEVKPSEMDFSRICDDDQPPDLEPIE